MGVPGGVRATATSLVPAGMRVTRQREATCKQEFAIQPLASLSSATKPICSEANLFLRSEGAVCEYCDRDEAEHQSNTFWTFAQ